MAPLRANLAACSVVAGSMSAACANTPASVADLQAVTGLSVLFCLVFSYYGCGVKHVPLGALVWRVHYGTDVHHLEESDLRFYANTYGGGQHTQRADVKRSEE